MLRFRSLSPWLPWNRRRVTPLAFVHLYKTAGTSINVFLTNRFPAGQCCRLYPEHGESYREQLPSRPVACYSGHLRFAEMTAVVPSGAAVISVLRDPIDRALSAYYGCRRQTRAVLARRDPKYLPVLDMDFAELVRERPLLCVQLFGDFQTNYLGRAEERGRVEDGSFIPPSRADLGRARDNLAGCLTGTTERLDDLVSLLCRERGWVPPACAPKANQNLLRPKHLRLDRESLAFLEEHTALDRELHRFAGELFQERLEKTPVDASRPAGESRVTFDGAIPGYGWHPRQQFQGTHYCFSEPRAWLVCRAPVGRNILLEIDTLPALPAGSPGPFTLRVNGREVMLTGTATRSLVTYRGVLTGGIDASEARMDFETQQPVRPCDVLPDSADDRLLGPAVTEVRLRAA